MLVLTRKRNESVIIGDQITVSIGEIRGDNVKLVIDAPREIKIYRSELYESIAKENQNAILDAKIDTLTLLNDVTLRKTER